LGNFKIDFCFSGKKILLIKTCFLHAFGFAVRATVLLFETFPDAPLCFAFSAPDIIRGYLFLAPIGATQKRKTNKYTPST
jgi:hypothetical protein